MKTRIEVTIYSDNLFNGDWGDMDQYDIDASADAYADQLRAELVRDYPEAEVVVNVHYEAGTDRESILTGDENDISYDREVVIDWVRELEARIYEAQDWVRMASNG
jgi:hypothetical protein